MATEIGYGKPPAESRFRKGSSGNPGGRPGPRRVLEKRFQRALERALLERPEVLAARKEESPIERLAGDLVCGAALADGAAIRLVLSLLPERGRKTKFPSNILRALNPDAGDMPSQGISDRPRPELPVR
ncbi:MAG TPA: DUF5681 domain-containing protein [Rhizomicrobium sp.]|jgi:hypothetical protein|nr:DUF5681 domain-containing protein [Rhizomicrobium sp.]